MKVVEGIRIKWGKVGKSVIMWEIWVEGKGSEDWELEGVFEENIVKNHYIHSTTFSKSQTHH